MKQAGQIALMPFPYTDLTRSKKRPVLLLRKLDNSKDDWLVCMISSQLRQADPELDWVLLENDGEFYQSGLKVSSVFRLSRVTILDGGLLLGRLGSISDERLQTLRERLGAWIERPAGPP